MDKNKTRVRKDEASRTSIVFHDSPLNESFSESQFEICHTMIFDLTSDSQKNRSGEVRLDHFRAFPSDHLFLC